MLQEKSRKKVIKVTHEAIAAISGAVEILSKQIPTEKLKQLKDSTPQLLQFSFIAQSSARLREASATILSYVQNGEALPQQLVSSTVATLHSVLDSLLSIVETKKSETHASKEMDTESPDEDNLCGSN